MLVLASSYAAAQLSAESATAQFRPIVVDARAEIGTIHSFQGVNGAPYPVREGLPNLVRQYHDLRIDSVRTHDSYGPMELDAVYEEGPHQWLDLLFPDARVRHQVMKHAKESLIFKDWAADPNDPNSYNFAASDKVVQSILDSGAKVFFRIGRSAGANVDRPKDLDKYAAVVAHVAMHYNQGWNHGFHNKVRFWAFW